MQQQNSGYLQQGRSNLLLLGGLGLLLIAAAGFWYQHYLTQNGKDNLLRANGRIEATEIAIASKSPGRIKTILVDEGDFVSAGQLLAEVDSDALHAQLAQAQAQLQQSESMLLTSQSQLQQRESEKNALKAVLKQREAELQAALARASRTDALAQSGSVSRQQADDNDTQVASARAALSAGKAQITAAEAAMTSAKAQILSAQSAVEAARATVHRVEVELNDNQLKAPRAGRIQYRIAQSGEVVAAGGKVLSLIDLTDVYMTFFLPSASAGQIALGSEVRLVLDAVPQRSIPAKVSYVADVAQFTPKTVETTSEREKLMFRVKAKISPALLQKHIQKVKTGLPGVAYLRLDDSQPWPDSLPELAQ